MRYYIADSHFFHGNMNTKMDNRGFSSTEEMNAYMIQQWNTKVRHNDEVIILGDLSWGTATETNRLLEQLHGKLYLVTGNHDRFLTSPGYNKNRFKWILPYKELNDNKRKVILCHYPILCYNGQYRLDDQGNPKTYMLYGHVHDTQDQRVIEQAQDIMRHTSHTNPDGSIDGIPTQMINCFCMYSDYIPLSLDEWIACTEKRLSLKAS